MATLNFAQILSVAIGASIGSPAVQPTSLYVVDDNSVAFFSVTSSYPNPLVLSILVVDASGAFTFYQSPPYPNAGSAGYVIAQLIPLGNGYFFVSFTNTSLVFMVRLTNLKTNNSNPYPLLSGSTLPNPCGVSPTGQQFFYDYARNTFADMTIEGAGGGTVQAAYYELIAGGFATLGSSYACNWSGGSNPFIQTGLSGFNTNTTNGQAIQVNVGAGNLVTKGKMNIFFGQGPCAGGAGDGSYVYLTSSASWTPPGSGGANVSPVDTNIKDLYGVSYSNSLAYLNQVSGVVPATASLTGSTTINSNIAVTNKYVFSAAQSGANLVFGVAVNNLPNVQPFPQVQLGQAYRCVNHSRPISLKGLYKS